MTRWVALAGWLATARTPGHIEQLEKPSSSRCESCGSWVGRITGTTGKSADDERVADGLVVAAKRSNVRGAKEPCCSSFFQQHGRQGRDDKDAHQSARPEKEDLHQGEGRHGLALLGPVRPCLQDGNPSRSLLAGQEEQRGSGP